MTTTKKITEEQAQVLANILRCCIAADRCGDVYWFANLPNNLEGYWSDDDGVFELLPIRIDSTRPWTGQIWRPE